MDASKNFHPRVKLVTLGRRSKSQILNFNYKDFYTKLCVFSKIKDMKHIKPNLHSFAWSMPQGWDLGCWGVKNLKVGICDSVQLTVHSSILLV